MAVVQSQAASITVPNGSFETLYKPGSTTVTADTGQGYTLGVGTGVEVGDDDNTALVNYSDSTTGGTAYVSPSPGPEVLRVNGKVDVPGWIQSTGLGSVSKQSSTSPYGSYFYMANGTNWGDTQSGTIQSANTLALVASGESYTLSIFVNDPNTDVDSMTGISDRLAGRTLDLLANGVALIPSFSTGTSGASETWNQFTNTYDAASLAAVVGKPLTIRVGWAAGSTGTQSKLDNVTLTSVSAIPEPTSLSLLALGALGLVRRKRR